MTTRTSSRIKKLTQPAMEIYEENVQKFKNTVNPLFDEIESITLIDIPKGDVKRLKAVERDFLTKKKVLEANASDFSNYLSRTCTVESNIENISLKKKISSIEFNVQEFLCKLNESIQEIEDNKTEVSSVASGSSRISAHSSVISVKLQAEAEAAKTKALFAEKEAQLKREKAEFEENEAIRRAVAERRKADLQTELQLLKTKEEEAIAIVKAETFEGSVHSIGNKSVLSKLSCHSPSSQEKVATFLENSSKVSEQQNILKVQNVQSEKQTLIHDDSSFLIPPEFAPPPPTTEQPSLLVESINDFSKYLLKKELLLNRLYRYDEKCENYLMWKTSFRTVMSELDVTAFEELDLMIKWLGPESSRQASSIRASCAGSAESARSRIWDRLDERYGAAERVEIALRQRLQAFPRLNPKDSKALYELYDCVSEINFLKDNPKYKDMFSFYDTSYGVSPIVAKLPIHLQERWTVKASEYKIRHSVPYPPFSFFVEFLNLQCRMKNDPSFVYEMTTSIATPQAQKRSLGVRVNKLNVDTNQSTYTPSRQAKFKCPLHNSNSHMLASCRDFKRKSYIDRKKLLKDNFLCFKCLDDFHGSCHKELKCSECGNNHHTAMHFTPAVSSKYGGEPQQRNRVPAPQGVTNSSSVNSSCTQVCGTPGFVGKSCAKIVLVEVSSKQTGLKMQTYALIDDQSNRSLASPTLFDELNVKGDVVEYSVNTCNGIEVKNGRKATDLVVTSVNENSVSYDMPSMLECEVPNNRDEIPTPEVALAYSHLKDLAPHIPPVDPSCSVNLLIGRDLIEAHHVMDQKIGASNMPYAHKLPLGWVIVGETCLGSSHITNNVNVNKTYIVGDGRASILPPCSSKYVVSEKCENDNVDQNNCSSMYIIDNGRYSLFMPCNNVHELDCMTYDFVFASSVRDEKASLSIEDREFLSIMDSEFTLGSDSKWSAPLPFKSPRPKLPNNKAQAFQRAKSLQNSLNKNPVKRQHFVDFMGNLLSSGHAELASKLADDAECWYLPIFGVYHPKKVDKIRVVFDSACQYNGVSLNSVLLQGPDLANSLLGVLLRFRREQVAVSVDVEQMFYCFGVKECDRDYLRFLWYEDNDPSKSLVEYRMCKHVFGNSPSPAIANYGLQKSVENSDEDVKEFVRRDFYVDDGLTSCPTVSEARSLIERTQASLAGKGIRLHKISSNVPDVMKGLSREDLSTDLSRLDFDLESLPTQRSLGLQWDLNKDYFLFDCHIQDRPVTKRGLLSSIHSVFDPIGFLSPILINGRLILRDVIASGIEWDLPLTTEFEAKWYNWLGSLADLECVKVSRSLFNVSLSEMSNPELHVFSDSSEKAIAAVVYVVGCSSAGEKKASFVMGKAKVAPAKGHTIPRLELCAAVLATELYTLVSENLGVNIADTHFYTDSRVVLGYIGNQTRRFHTYVSNRVQKIRRVSSPKQWRYVATDKNPADIGTRGASPKELQDGLWLSGPTFLCTQETPMSNEFFPLLNPQLDVEVRTDVVTMKTSVGSNARLETDRFERFSSWSRLLLALSVLVHVVSSFKKCCSQRGWHRCSISSSPESKSRATEVVLREVQYDCFKAEVDALSSQSPVGSSSTLVALDPFLDDVGLLRVGGRLRQGDFPIEEKHPIILAAKHHVTKLLIRHYHESVQHQGRLFTEGAVRQAGYWIVGGKRAISSLLFNCVTCKKLRGSFEKQKMSDLPSDRLQQNAPFSYVGVDCFGPWQVVSRKTRSSQASAKRWAVLFTCLSVRAVHIEVVDEMSSSAFINALRRLIAIRGPVKMYRSDRGTNFVGATDHIGVDVINVEDGDTKDFIAKTNSVWVFNSPHSSHMGGIWERMIGVSRRILESMLSNTHTLTHDVLATLMAEVSAIINSRPIVPVSTDPECPEVLSPSALLTMKLDLDQQPVDEMSLKDLYKDQWKRVQYLANQFWLRWRKEFLQSLQTRPKWHHDQSPLKVNDIVLLRDYDVPRNCWPKGRVNKIFPSTDGKIRKVELCIINAEGKQSFLVRPIVEMVLLVRY
jgi:hypothetical protein